MPSDFQYADYGMHCCQIEVLEGLIFITLASKGSAEFSQIRNNLLPYLKPHDLARTKVVHRDIYPIDANWKLTYDNFQENYHLRFIHPSAAGPVTSPDNPFAYPTAYDFHGPHRSQRIWTKPDMDPPTGEQAIAFQRGAVQAMVDGILGTETAKDYLGLFPNFFLFGSPMQHFSHTVYPIAAGKST